ncbi:MAG: exodeoxyribonuclease VII large subunit, partial [Lactobacillaceae bacterium]|nr:exodeoxyribonuclease VII large subunit [Lactobacillaceae bacterium]
AKIKALYDRFLKQGLFLPERKKPIPSISKKIAVVSSPTGAVIQDIKYTVNRRFPETLIELFPTTVQGDNAALEIVEALKRADSSDADLIILARGGGSKGDLMVFNDERIVYTISELKKPIITSIGHQIDTTLSDLVADKKADTPTAAAEMSTPDIDYLFSTLDGLTSRLNNGIDIMLKNKQEELNDLVNRIDYENLKHIIEKFQIQNQNTQVNMSNIINNILISKNNQASILNEKLEALNPKNILKLGYSVIEDKNNKIVSDINRLKKLDEIYVTLENGKEKLGVMHGI